MSTVRGLINNFTTTVNETLTDSDTTITVTDATGITTALTTADFVPLTIDDGTNIEIVHCTGASSNDLTVVRGREGTSGTAFASGTTIECRLTQEAIADSHQWVPVEVRTLGAGSASEDFDLTAGTYKLEFAKVWPDTGSDDLHLQQITSGPTVQTTTYYHSGYYTTYLTAFTTAQGNNTSQLTLLTACNSDSYNPIHGEVLILDVDDSSIRHVYEWRMNQQSKMQIGTGVRDVTQAMIGVRVKFSSGNIASGSKFILWKRKH